MCQLGDTFHTEIMQRYAKHFLVIKLTVILFVFYWLDGFACYFVGFPDFGL